MIEDHLGVFSSECGAAMEGVVGGGAGRDVDELGKCVIDVPILALSEAA